MKIKMSFVTNSSSTSYVIIAPNKYDEELEKIINKVEGGGKNDSHTGIEYEYIDSRSNYVPECWGDLKYKGKEILPKDLAKQNLSCIEVDIGHGEWTWNEGFIRNIKNLINNLEKNEGVEVDCHEG